MEIELITSKTNDRIYANRKGKNKIYGIEAPLLTLIINLLAFEILIYSSGFIRYAFIIVGIIIKRIILMKNALLFVIGYNAYLIRLNIFICFCI